MPRGGQLPIPRGRTRRKSILLYTGSGLFWPSLFPAKGHTSAGIRERPIVGLPRRTREFGARQRGRYRRYGTNRPGRRQNGRVHEKKMGRAAGAGGFGEAAVQVRVSEKVILPLSRWAGGTGRGETVTVAGRQAGGDGAGIVGGFGVRWRPWPMAGGAPLGQETAWSRPGVPGARPGASLTGASVCFLAVPAAVA